MIPTRFARIISASLSVALPAQASAHQANIYQSISSPRGECSNPKVVACEIKPNPKASKSVGAGNVYQSPINKYPKMIVREGPYIYKTIDNKTAVFDPRQGKLTSPDGVFVFQDCSNTDIVCLQATNAWIQTPKTCPLSQDLSKAIVWPPEFLQGSQHLRLVARNVVDAYVSGTGGAVYYTDTDKFGYIYDTTTGVSEFIIIPNDVNETVSSANFLFDHRFSYMADGPGPYACRQESN